MECGLSTHFIQYRMIFAVCYSMKRKICLLLVVKVMEWVFLCSVTPLFVPIPSISYETNSTHLNEYKLKRVVCYSVKRNKRLLNETY